MKTLLFLIFLVMGKCVNAQIHEGNAQLNECKRLTLDLLRNNTQNSNLTNCLVSLASEGGNYITEYNSWMTQISQNSQEQLQAELNNLEAQKQQATEIRQQSFGNLLNNVNQTVQNHVQQNSYQNKSGSAVAPRDCVNGPGKGCGQQ